MADQGCGAGRNPGADGQEDEEDRKRERHGCQGCGGEPPAVEGVHHVEHGIEEETGAGRDRQPADQLRYGGGGQVRGHAGI